jgi:exodeoxyribonuclease V alpha subunit
VGQSDSKPAIGDAAWLAREAVPLPEFKTVNHPSPALPESLSGLIGRVTFCNEENGWAVLKVKAKGHRDLVTVVGSLPSVSPGEWLTAQGRWVQDREFGLQFRAEMLASTAPTTKEGIEKYLGSGMVKGIGPVYAKKLVDRFGERIFEIIETESARLEELDGIGPKRRRRIKEAWAATKCSNRSLLEGQEDFWSHCPMKAEPVFSLQD